jgi:hypothetical protein
MEETEDDASILLLEGDVPILPDEMKEDDTGGTNDDATIKKLHPMSKTFQTTVTIHRRIEIKPLTE